ncbi:MAG TPA: HEAT repeat domain-containing protein [Ktedonobacteraceae bacterium]|nr:HEAT repeat domain-containing protein [Ktedonobacteraceae bacterium]
MDEVKKILQDKEKIERGGKKVRTIAEQIHQDAVSEDQCKKLALDLFAHEEPAVKMVAVFLFGMLASRTNNALSFLYGKVSQEQDWRVQEILAQAFDRYCSDIGYESALPTIKAWLADNNANVRRAASEGLRIWTSRPFFKDHPEIALQLLSALKDDESEYVRKSAGNALRDISRKHKTLVANEVQAWDTSDKRVLFTYKLASKFLE